MHEASFIIPYVLSGVDVTDGIVGQPYQYFARCTVTLGFQHMREIQIVEAVCSPPRGEEFFVSRDNVQEEPRLHHCCRAANILDVQKPPAFEKYIEVGLDDSLVRLGR